MDHADANAVNSPSKKQGKANEDKPSREALARMALNEHGFLFQSRVSNQFVSTSAGRWRLAATEYPVSFGPLFPETRIDFVIERRSKMMGVSWHLAVESKRGNPDYKSWLFFDERPRLVDERPNSFFIEAGEFLNQFDARNHRKLSHRIIRSEIPRNMAVPLFSYYLEARENLPSRGSGASSTKAIEDAFYQTTLGCAGLAHELDRLGENNFRVVPLVVTTAEIFAAAFDPEKVSVDRGEIPEGDLQLRPLNWLCVNYAISDKVATFAGLTSSRGRSLDEELAARFLRSIFVVRATHLTEFLNWFDELVDRNPR